MSSDSTASAASYDLEGQLLALGGGVVGEHEVGDVLPARAAGRCRRGRGRSRRCRATTRIERRPLWPLSPPPSLIRRVPKAMSSSSWIGDDPLGRAPCRTSPAPRPARRTRSCSSAAARARRAARRTRARRAGPRRRRRGRSCGRAKGDPIRLGQLVGDEVADVVPVPGVGRAGVAQPDDQPDRRRGRSVVGDPAYPSKSAAVAPQQSLGPVEVTRESSPSASDVLGRPGPASASPRRTSRSMPASASASSSSASSSSAVGLRR